MTNGFRHHGLLGSSVVGRGSSSGVGCQGQGATDRRTWAAAVIESPDTIVLDAEEPVIKEMHEARE